ncbi:MAG: hypothetical protein K6G26_01475 [Lachnospiraceae bacterium]|nr:hypothetical protein [Lachnospiraceae bacterium]
MLNCTFNAYNSIGFLCNDLRYLYLANKLSYEKYNVFAYNMPPDNISSNITLCNSVNDLCKKAQIIFAPFPLKDVSFIKYLNNTHTLISGGFNNDILSFLQNNSIKYIDLLKDESFILFNSIATAEGTVAKAIELTPINIARSKSLVLGYGRCGHTIAYTLRNLNSKVTVCARTNSKMADTPVYDFDTMVLPKLASDISKFDIIINTVPSPIISNEMIDSLKKDTIIIDIASSPGLDHHYAENNNITTIHYLGIPGKISPKSTAVFLFDLLFN